MVAWVVIDRQHHRQAGPFAALLSTPLIPLPHLSPLLPTPYGHSYTTAAPNPFAINPLRTLFIATEGVLPLPVHWNEFASSETEEPFFTPHYSCVLCFHALAHSFALICTFLHSRKTQLSCFQSFPHSLRKTTRGGVPP